MRRAIIVLAVSAALGACAAPGAVNTPHAALERAETTAELAYQGAVPLMTPAQKDAAWADLQKVRIAYNAGQDITVLVAALTADLPKGAK